MSYPLHNVSFGNTFLMKRAKNTEQIPFGLILKIQFKILEFPRFDLHVLLNSIIMNHQKAKFLTVCTHVSAV